LLLDEAQGDDGLLTQTNNWMGGDIRSTRPPSIAGFPHNQQTIATTRTVSGGGIATMSAFASANDAKTVRTV
jgi:hypothetical protein